MKTKLALEEPKRLVYRNFKSFNNDYFEEELSSKLDLNNKDYADFEDNCVNVLTKLVPKKTKTFRGNHKPHVFKTLRLVIMKRSRLKNKANKTQLPIDKQSYKKQRNLVTKLNKQYKKNISIISKIKTFGTSVSHISQISTITVTRIFNEIFC